MGGLLKWGYKMSARVFISYTSRDDCVSDAVLKKAKALFPEQSRVFVDRLSEQSSWHPQLVIMLKVIRAHLFVVIESRSVYQSQWVLLEILLAKITLTPIIRMPVELLNQRHNKEL